MTVTEVEPLLLKYRVKGIILDTNLLLLLLAGNCGEDVLSTFKPVKNHGFTLSDFQLLRQILLIFSRILVTPHILAEVSNHSEKLKGELHQRFIAAMRQFLSSADEHYHPAKDVSAREEFPRFGLTDSGISSLAAGEYLVLTVDFPLAGFLNSNGIDAVNFNNLRPLAWE